MSKQDWEESEDLEGFFTLMTLNVPQVHTEKSTQSPPQIGVNEIIPPNIKEYILSVDPHDSTNSSLMKRQPLRIRILMSLLKVAHCIYGYSNSEELVDKYIENTQHTLESTIGYCVDVLLEAAKGSDPPNLVLSGFAQRLAVSNFIAELNSSYPKTATTNARDASIHKVADIIETIVGFGEDQCIYALTETITNIAKNSNSNVTWIDTILHTLQRCSYRQYFILSNSLIKSLPRTQKHPLARHLDIKRILEACCVWGKIGVDLLCSCLIAGVCSVRDVADEITTLTHALLACACLYEDGDGGGEERMAAPQTSSSDGSGNRSFTFTQTIRQFYSKLGKNSASLLKALIGEYGQSSSTEHRECLLLSDCRLEHFALSSLCLAQSQQGQSFQSPATPLQFPLLFSGLTAHSSSIRKTAFTAICTSLSLQSALTRVHVNAIIDYIESSLMAIGNEERESIVAGCRMIAGYARRQLYACIRDEASAPLHDGGGTEMSRARKECVVSLLSQLTTLLTSNLSNMHYSKNDLIFGALLAMLPAAGSSGCKENNQNKKDNAIAIDTKIDQIWQDCIINTIRGKHSEITACALDNTFNTIRLSACKLLQATLFTLPRSGAQRDELVSRVLRGLGSSHAHLVDGAALFVACFGGNGGDCELSLSGLIDGNLLADFEDDGKGRSLGMGTLGIIKHLHTTLKTTKADLSPTQVLKVVKKCILLTTASLPFLQLEAIEGAQIDEMGGRPEGDGGDYACDDGDEDESFKQMNMHWKTVRDCVEVAVLLIVSHRQPSSLPDSNKHQNPFGQKGGDADTDRCLMEEIKLLLCRQLSTFDPKEPFPENVADLAAFWITEMLLTCRHPAVYLPLGKSLSKLFHSMPGRGAEDGGDGHATSRTTIQLILLTHTLAIITRSLGPMKTTRRSAGIPLLVSTLLTHHHRHTATTPSTLCMIKKIHSCLLLLGGEGEESGLKTSTTIHTLNILKQLCKDSQHSLIIIEALPAIFRSALSLLSHADWSVANGALQLFAALMPRCFGVKHHRDAAESAGDWRDRRDICEVERRVPGLIAVICEAMEARMGGDGCDDARHTFPLLAFTQRLSFTSTPSASTKHPLYHGLIIAFLHHCINHSKIAKVRTVAGEVLARACRESRQVKQQTFSQFGIASSGADVPLNVLHGRLLVIEGIGACADNHPYDSTGSMRDGEAAACEECATVNCWIHRSLLKSPTTLPLPFTKQHLSHSHTRRGAREKAPEPAVLLAALQNNEMICDYSSSSLELSLIVGKGNSVAVDGAEAIRLVMGLLRSRRLHAENVKIAVHLLFSLLASPAATSHRKALGVDEKQLVKESFALFESFWVDYDLAGVHRMTLVELWPILSPCHRNAKEDFPLVKRILYFALTDDNARIREMASDGRFLGWRASAASLLKRLLLEDRSCFDDLLAWMPTLPTDYHHDHKDGNDVSAGDCHFSSGRRLLFSREPLNAYLDFAWQSHVLLSNPKRRASANEQYLH